MAFSLLSLSNEQQKVIKLEFKELLLELGGLPTMQPETRMDPQLSCWQHPERELDLPPFNLAIT